jgi:hypothetical protein
MPAVVVEVGPATTVVEQTPSLAEALAAALGLWVSSRYR